MKTVKTVLISGCGDIGQRVANIWRQRSIKVTGLARTVAHGESLKSLDITPYIGDLDDSATLAGLPFTDALLYHFAPPPNTGNTDLRLANLLNVSEKNNTLPNKVVLISTTAVYGNCHGQWVDEQEPINPATDRGKRRLYAEQCLQQWSQRTGVPYVILRVPGIYGPGRLPVARIKQGAPILKENESPYTNRIHAEDLANICVLAAQNAPANSLYNVSDGNPGTMSQYFKAIATTFHLPCPPEISMAEAQSAMSAGMLSYLKESRRINNAKMLKELHVKLKYTDLQAGLAAMI